MNRFAFLLFISVTTLMLSCKGDDTGGCVTCSAPNTLDFTLCEEGDGNASVNGENTGTPYGVYIQDLRADGATCGGA